MHWTHKISYLMEKLLITSSNSVCPIQPGVLRGVIRPGVVITIFFHKSRFDLILRLDYPDHQWLVSRCFRLFLIPTNWKWLSQFCRTKIIAADDERKSKNSDQMQWTYTQQKGNYDRGPNKEPNLEEEEEKEFNFHLL